MVGRLGSGVFRLRPNKKREQAQRKRGGAEREEGTRGRWKSPRLQVEEEVGGEERKVILRGR